MCSASCYTLLNFKYISYYKIFKHCPLVWVQALAYVPSVGAGGVRSLYGAVQMALGAQRLSTEEISISVNPSSTVGIGLPKGEKTMEMNVVMVN